MRPQIAINLNPKFTTPKFKFGLGINSQTGRLQWCPDFRCSSVLVVLPFILLFICLTSVLLSQLNLLPCLRKECPTTHYNNTSSNSSNNNNNNDNDLNIYLENLHESNILRKSKCDNILINQKEPLDNEDNLLMRDMTTSFLPSDYDEGIPPGCLPFLNNDEQPRKLRSKRSLQYELLNGNLDIEDDSGSYGFFNITNNSEFEKSFQHSYIDPRIVLPQHLAPSKPIEKPEIEKSRRNVRRIQAETMKRYIDYKTDPCTDFYQFSCGNWVKYNPIPKDKAGYDTFEMLRESLDIVLRDLLNDNGNENSPSTIQNVNLFPAIITDNEKQITSRPETFERGSDSKTHNINIKKMSVKKRAALAHYLVRLKKKQNSNRKRRQAFKVKNRESQRKEINAESKAKYLYQSCMNSNLLAKRGVDPLLKLINELGGWPVLDPHWSGKHFNWLNLTAQLRLYNNDIFIVEWVGPDLKDSDENMIQIDQTSLGLPTRDYFIHESNMIYLVAYKEFMTTIMSLMGASNATATKTATEVVNFEIELAKITTSSEERLNVSTLYKRLTVGELVELVPQIDWITYLTIVQGRPVQTTEPLVVYAIEFFQSLVELLKKTQNKVISNYLMWRFVRHRINNLDDRFQDCKQKFFFVLFGREQSPPRWKNCVAQVNSNMGMALGAMFVRKYFDESSKEDMLKMTFGLQEAFRDILNSTYWLDNSTKKLAELKVNSMSLKIGYPDYILNRRSLDEKYEGLDIKPHKYFENTVNVLRHVTKIEQSKINERVNKTLWQTAPAIVNAYYSRNKNQIMFPAGILQPPFYHRHFPRSLNYGGIGVVIGHELTHGFDDKGRLFDGNGNIHKWWSDSAITEFHQRASCIISQYGNYTVPEVGIPLDGDSTQGENIADNGGIRQAFHSYKNWLSQNSDQSTQESELLPGLDMNNNQLFFLNFAQVWCGAMRPEAMRNKLKTAVHSPGKFRVIGTLSNSRDFARVFNCSSGTPMNPVHKCSIW